MNVGRRVDYAVRALSYLAAQATSRVIGGREISEKQDIPSHYLSKIMKDFVAAGLVKGGAAVVVQPSHHAGVDSIFEINSVKGYLAFPKFLYRQ